MEIREGGGGFDSKSDLQFAFVTILDQKDIKDRTRQQEARTQAIRNSLQQKRRDLLVSRNNFVDATPRRDFKRRTQRRQNGANEATVDISQRPVSFKSHTLDPFTCLAVDADRLASLLRHNSARQAGEPVFSVNDQLEYQRLHTIFKAGFEDPALASALCLTLAFTANGGFMDEECWKYRFKAIKHLNEKLSSQSEACSIATVGTVLLLVGVEGRLRKQATAQVHLNGIRQLLVLCNERKTYLSHAMKRAVFWQDLFTAFLAGTRRVLSHETFPEMHWHRDPYQASLFVVPDGFSKRADDLGLAFLSIVEDISALQKLVENMNGVSLTSLDVEKIDNQQAWIESRLEQLRHQRGYPLLLFCIPAAYLCAYSLFAEVWSSSLMPSALSWQLLQHLQTSKSWHKWDEHADLLLWLLIIGAAFANDSTDQRGYADLCLNAHRARLQPLSQSWEEIEGHVKAFIWSDRVHRPRYQAFCAKMHKL